MDYKKADAVQANKDFSITVWFKDGSVKKFDLNKWEKLQPKAVATLREDQELFCSVRLDKFGSGIIWNDDIDVDTDDIWHVGETVDGIREDDCP